MITTAQLDEALLVIANYKKQLESELEIGTESNNQKIDISDRVDMRTFHCLCHYFYDALGIQLFHNDIYSVDVQLLKSINYSKLAGYRNIGKVSMKKLKEAMIYYGIIETEKNS
jgi:hypothetical protein